MAANNDELACTYSALILADDDVPITVSRQFDIACHMSGHECLDTSQYLS